MEKLPRDMPSLEDATKKPTAPPWSLIEAIRDPQAFELGFLMISPKYLWG